MREFLFLALVLACPLMMIFMMRGGHARGGHDHSGDDEPEATTPRERMSLDQLKHERDELNELIAQRAEQIVASRH